jgi:hypothetical protein
MKKIIFFILCISLISFVSAIDSETIYSCGGDSETVFSCDFGDTQNYITRNILSEGEPVKSKVLEFYTNLTIEKFIYYILIPFIVILLLVFFIFCKIKRKKKNL